MSYTINPNAKNKWARNAENTMDLSLETDASSVYLDNGRTLEQEIGEGSMVSNVATVDSAMSRVTEGTYDGAYESCVFKGQTLVNLWKKHSTHNIGNFIFYDDGFMETKPNVRYFDHIQKAHTNMIKPNTKYLLIIEVEKNTLPVAITYQPDARTFFNSATNQSSVLFEPKQIGRATKILTSISDLSSTQGDLQWGAYIQFAQANYASEEQGIVKIRQMLLEYQEGMENWDIPYFEGMTSVKMPILRNVGKNLFDKNTMKTSWWINQNGVKKDSGNTNYSILVPATQNKVYSVSFDVSNRSFYAFLDKDYNTLLLQTGYVTKTAPQGTKYLLYYLHSENIDLCGDIQLEEATAKTAHEDYKTNILRTSEEIVLREVGGVCDTYNVLTGEYVQRIGETIFDGSDDESWAIYTNNRAKTIQFRFDMKSTAKGQSDYTKIISSHLPSVDIINNNDIEGVSIYSNGNIYISLLRTKAETLSSLKSYLQSNPITVQYELAQPITTIIEPLTIPFAYENGHVILESGYEGQSLLPTLEYSTVINKTGLVESVAKTIQRQEKQLTMLEQMLIQNIINLDYNNTLLTLKNEMEEMF